MFTCLFPGRNQKILAAPLHTHSHLILGSGRVRCLLSSLPEGSLGPQKPHPHLRRCVFNLCFSRGFYATPTRFLYFMK